MKLAMFRPKADGGAPERLGLVVDGRVEEVAPFANLEDLFLRGGRPDEGLPTRGVSYLVSEVALGPPVRRPGKIVAAIVNTQGMLGGDAKLDRPRLDMKAPSTVIGAGESILAPPQGIRPEVELAAVIGRKLSRASVEQAAGGVFGYTILNDVTAPSDSRSDAYEAFRRNRQTGVIERSVLRGPLFRSKNHDTFCPIGPWIVTADEFVWPRKAKMATSFDGTAIQAGDTSEYLFSPEEIASYVSGFLTLEAGDVVSCGSVGWTPEALGTLDPTEYILPMRPGVLRLEIEGIGVLQNPVVPG